MARPVVTYEMHDSSLAYILCAIKISVDYQTEGPGLLLNLMRSMRPFTHHPWTGTLAVGPFPKCFFRRLKKNLHASQKSRVILGVVVRVTGRIRPMDVVVLLSVNK